MISIIVHGGAWDIPDNAVESHHKGVEQALEVGWRILTSGGSAIDAVEQAVRAMENDETFDAGYGSHLNQLGVVELDASIMDGKTIRCGAVAAVHHIRNPITVARKIMDESEHILLVGNGAEQYAKEHGIAICESAELVTKRERDRWESLRTKKEFKTKDTFQKLKISSDTVGVVALDQFGNICTGTSTGGTPNKYPGRVGDSPLIGCGTYADNEVGGVSTTGWGEAMIKVVMAKTVIDLMEINGGDAQDAAEKGIEILHRKADGFGGVIALNKNGGFGISFNTPRMARAYMNTDMNKPFIAV
ncbi:MAG: isoaspartyl peptidase/L-asparaginase [Ignavibacteriales bacterium]|nr:isoaspartyl peptidase/L-asparaginase [Ignavibacteriales bacterium]